MFGSMTDLQATPAAPATHAPRHRYGDLPASVEGRALFLDVDGTLLDIADRPEDVQVPPHLLDSLALLAARLEGALALVSGRSLARLRQFFPDLSCGLAGLHGAEIAYPGGTHAAVQRSPELQGAIEALSGIAAAWPGVEIEDKGGAFAAHYRLAPRFASAVEVEMERLARRLGDQVVVQKGKCVIEIRPAGHDKGTALLEFMSQPPFAGRTPVAVGDDLTDEAMFRAANELGGLSVKVGAQGDTLARGIVSSPGDVRAWIADVAR